MTTRLEKPVRRELDIRGRAYIVELSPAGVTFREKGKRYRLLAPFAGVLNFAEHIAGEAAYVERRRARAARRSARGAVMVLAFATAAAVASCSQLTGVPPKPRCTAPSTFHDTIVVQFDSLQTDTTLTLHLGGCR